MRCDRPSDALKFKYRVSSAKQARWQDADSGKVVVESVPQGSLKLEYAAKDFRFGDQSPVYTRSWNVHGARFEVTDLRDAQGRLVASLTDRLNGQRYDVGYGDTVADHKVVQISLAHRKIVLESSSEEHLSIDVPDNLAEPLLKAIKVADRDAREKATLKARSKSSSTSRRRSRYGYYPLRYGR
jgi:hypothetical protein